MTVLHDAPQPFVGVCGVQSLSDYTELCELAAQVLPGTGRFLMAGCKDSGMTIDPAVLSPEVQAFIHCDFSADEPFERIVQRNIARTKQYARGLQLNVLPWMDVDYAPLWKALKRQYPTIKLMLQAHQAIVERHTPEDIARRLAGLPVDYILFDASQSRGVPFDLAGMGQNIQVVKARAPHIGVVVAGGLGGDNVQELFGPLAARYPDLSCDAFLRLYDQDAGHISWPAVRSYLANWQRAVGQTPQ